jgi:hypothetical protein
VPPLDTFKTLYFAAVRRVIRRVSRPCRAAFGDHGKRRGSFWSDLILVRMTMKVLYS